MSENSNVGFGMLTINKTGIEWFDELIERDEKVKESMNKFDLFELSKRIKELKAQHGIIKPVSQDE